MKEPKSKLPWRIKGTSLNIVSKDDTILGHTSSIQDAEYITQAYNNFPEAISLLKRVREYHKKITEFAPDTDWKLLIELRDFLKLLEKEGNDQS